MTSEAESVRLASVNADTARVTNFNDGWKFNLGDVNGAEAASYDDSAWDQVTLPHDYSIDQDYSKSMEAESAYKPGGTGWYRKSFFVDEALKGKAVELNFDGVYNNATIYVNGHKVAFHPYGYSPFTVDIADYLAYGGENTVAVKVDHKTPSSRFYSGSGIYRDVTLLVANPLHVQQNGVQVTTPDLASNQSSVATKVVATVVNEGEDVQTVAVNATVLDAQGKTVATANTGSSLDEGETKAYTCTPVVTDPTLWSLGNPYLYTVKVEVLKGEELVDTYETTFGYRYFSFDADTGFSLNGEAVKLQGVCMHHDQGSLGSVANDAAVDRQVRLLKEMGANAIRVTHNPASQQLIDACNEQGILMVEEAFDGWDKAKNGNSQDFSVYFNKTVGDDAENLVGATSSETWAQFSIQNMVKRGANAPAIIMWSLGNEMSEGTSGGGSSWSSKHINNLSTWVKEIDTTRPVTTGDNRIKGGGNLENSPSTLDAQGGIIGTNYSNGSQYDTLRAKFPTYKFYGAETASSINSRGVYSTRANGRLDANKQLTSYDCSAVGWGATAASAWYDVITRDFMAGEFVWTGFDYLGEPTPANGTGSGAATSWPSPKNSYFGIIDTAGLPKDSYYLYQALWNKDMHTLHLLPAWNENVVTKAGGKVPVVVYSDAAAVELFFTPAGSTTRTSLGKKTFEKHATSAGFTYQTETGKSGASSLYFTWDVAYADGTLTAVAYDEDGQVISDTQGRSSVTTTGAAAKLTASADRKVLSADGQDLSYVTINVADADGNMVPDAANKVTVKVEGAGTLAAMDNGSSPDHQSYRDNNRKAFSGQVVAIVRANDSTKDGAIKVTASAEGLEPVTVELSAKGVKTEGAAATISSVLMSKNYYVKTGSALTLPSELTATYSDGSTKQVAVKWAEISADKLAQAGKFSASGTVEGQKVSVTVTVLDQVDALLAYSTTTPLGTVPTLPSSLPGVLADGTVLDANFPVEWNMPENNAYDEAGTVKIEGMANVFGRELTVTASVRVQKQKVTVTDTNVAPQAAELTQDEATAANPSDTLNAVKDGSTVISANTSGGANPTCWSNWAFSKAGGTSSELTFRYDTAQLIGRATVYYSQDSGAMTMPGEGHTELYWSPDGTTWTRIEGVTETVGATEDRVAPYTFDFSPVEAVYFKVKVTNGTPKSGKQFACTGITEIELMKAQGSYETYSTTDLASLTVNGTALTETELNKDVYYCAEETATIAFEAKDNAAVTALPATNSEMKLIVRSEDHSTQRTITIKLGQEAPLDPSDDSRDYPVDSITVKTGSEQPQSGSEGPVHFAFDGNQDTYYHSKWTPTTLDDLWVSMELADPTAISALRYLPRNGNGDVTRGVIETSEDGITWQAVKQVDFDRSTFSDWQLVEFDSPVTAKYFRFRALGTYADSGNDKFMSAREIRLVKAKEQPAAKKDLTEGTLTLSETVVRVDVVDAQNPVTLSADQIAVKHGETILTAGTDYSVTYENNVAPGTATVIVTGMGAYTGTLSATFVIERNPATVTGIAIDQNAPGCKLVYTEGDAFDPAGLMVTKLMSYGDNQQVVYSEDAGMTFSVEPGTALTATGEQRITVTLDGRTAAFTIMVNEKQVDPDPDPDPDPKPDPTAKHTVTFMVNNEVFMTTQVENGSTVDKPASVTAFEGYTFLEWRLNGAAYDFATPVTGDITLVAYYQRTATKPTTDGKPDTNTATAMPTGTKKLASTGDAASGIALVAAAGGLLSTAGIAITRHRKQ